MADVSKGLLVRVEAEPGREEELAQHLKGALPAVLAEPDTTVWLALRLGETSFAVVDAFPHEEGRQAHLEAGRQRLASLDILAEPPALGFTEILAAKIAPDPRLEEHKQTVLAFYEAAINDKDFEAASKYLGDEYVQHNPRIADGIDGFRAFITELKETFPNLRAEVKRIVAEGDLVMAHVHGIRVPGQPGTAIVDIFRLAEGRIVEHWDVTQPVPENAENDRGMF